MVAFGSQTSMSNGTSSTGVFRAPQASYPCPSTPGFGCCSPSSPIGSSLYGQKTGFGRFASTDTQTSLFGGATQPSQPAFGSSSSTPFGASTGTPAFGATSTPAFGVTSTPAFGSTSSPTFGNNGNAFGVPSAPVFGGGGAFRASSNPLLTSAFYIPPFGCSSTSAFSTSRSTPFGVSIASTPACGASSTPACGACSTPANGASSTPSFSFGPTKAFGQSSSTFGSSSPFGSTTSPFGGQSSAFGSPAPTPAFGSTGFGHQPGGSGVASYSATTEADSGTFGQTAKFESISAMPVYKDKSLEELRWEDYQLGDKGGPLPSAHSTGMAAFSSSTIQTSPFSPSQVFGQTSTNPSSNPFAQRPQNSLFSTPTSGGTSAAHFFKPSDPIFFGYPQPSFIPAAPTNAQPTSTFGQNTPFGQTASFGQSNLFNSPVSGLAGNIFSTSPSLTSTAQPISTPFQFQPPQVAPSSGTFGFSNFGQTQPVFGGSCCNCTRGMFGQNNGGTPGMFGQNNGGTPGMFAQNNGGTPGMFAQNNFAFPSSRQSSMVAQPAPATDPLAALRALQASFADLSIFCVVRL
ncbi:nuclear pore complex protein NUP98A-like isoform X2 [Lotus japonicus]|uniref:nuclear pore complex protein NUP98A-like isoform X2 n=1 Tax=Lotus japonicus TaxID=34305 RepID=UPI00258FAD62|nr:nuclear pore complex protein NUP98A-like isoform X2 [Lotus japonicus]